LRLNRDKKGNALDIRGTFKLITAAGFFIFSCGPAFAGAPEQNTREAVIFLALNDAENAQRESAIREAFEEAELSSFGAAPGKETGWSLRSLLHPYAFIDTAYDDNIYLLAHNTKSDWVSVLNPGVALRLGREGKQGKGIKFDLGVGAKLISYYHQSRENRQLPYANFLLELRGRSNLLSLSNEYRRDYVPTSSLVTDYAGGFADYDYNLSEAGWESVYNRLGFDLNYRREWRLYKKDYKRTNSFEDRMGTITGFIQAFPKTRFILEGDYGKYDYIKDIAGEDNSKYIRGWAGVNGRITSKISALAKLGYEKVDYNDGSNHDGMTYSLDLDYAYSRRTNFYIRSWYGNKQGNYRADGNLDEEAISLGLRHIINRKTTFNLGTYYYSDDYIDGRKDKLFGVSSRLEYNFAKWMQLYLEYNFNKRNSNEALNDYSNNVCRIGLKSEF